MSLKTPKLWNDVEEDLQVIFVLGLGLMEVKGINSVPLFWPAFLSLVMLTGCLQAWSLKASF